MVVELNSENAQPYYSDNKDFSQSNKRKAKLGESGFYKALADFPILCNVTYGHRQKDIDHLVLTCDFVIFNECKNVKEDFQMYYSWFLSHVVDRYADGLPVAQYYARSLGYATKNVTFTLTIPYLNTDSLVYNALNGLKIEVIQTKKQLLEERDIKQWYSPIRTQFLSVINTRTTNRDTTRKERSRRKRSLSKFVLSLKRQKSLLREVKETENR